MGRCTALSARSQPSQRPRRSCRPVELNETVDGCYKGINRGLIVPIFKPLMDDARYCVEPIGRHGGDIARCRGFAHAALPVLRASTDLAARSLVCRDGSTGRDDSQSFISSIVQAREDGPSNRPNGKPAWTCKCLRPAHVVAIPRCRRSSNLTSVGRSFSGCI